MTGTPTRLCLKAVGTSLTALYSAVQDGKTAIKDIMVTNTTGSPILLSVFIGSQAAANAFGWYETPIDGKSSQQFNGYQIMNAAETLNAIASVAGLTICVSGEERI